MITSEQLQSLQTFAASTNITAKEFGAGHVEISVKQEASHGETGCTVFVRYGAEYPDARTFDNMDDALCYLGGLDDGFYFAARHKKLK